jgi:hypothetical protein
VGRVPIPAAKVQLQQGAAADENDLLEWYLEQSAAPDLSSWPPQLANHRNGKIPRPGLGERFLCELG